MRRLPALLLFSLTALPLAGCSSSENNPTEPDAGADACPPLAEPASHEGVLSADETWGAGLHVVTNHVKVGPGVTLTVEPCAVVRLEADVSLEVDGDGAALVAAGTATQPVVFERATDAAWGSLAAFAPAQLRLSHTTLRGGGTTRTAAQADYVGASLVGRNLGTTPTDTVSVEEVRIEDSNGLGVMLVGSGFVAGSRGLTVTGAGLNPVYLGAGHATNLPEGAYVGNGDDRFLLQSAGPAVYENIDPLLWDATLPDRGLPYLVGFEGTYPSISVGDGREESPAATLTIEPGVELRFQGGATTSAQLIVRGKPDGDGWAPQGTLIANGTASAPIVFTSAEEAPQPGDWQGLYFKNVVSSQTSLSHVRVAYAGGETSSTGLCVSTAGAENNDADCSAVLFLDVPPTQQFITDAVFEHGIGCGIYRGWSGAAVDFTATNTFTDLTGCDQSNVYDDPDGCTGPCQ